MGIRFLMEDRYTGHGASDGLARGLLVYHNDENITSEGMGIGAAALRINGLTYFSSCSGIETAGPGLYRKKFVFDKRMAWSVFSLKSRILASIIERVTAFYMSHGFLQKTAMHAKLGAIAQKIFRLRPQFEKTESRGEAVFEYRVNGDSVFVHSKIKPGQGGIRKIYVMNEASADFFNTGICGGRIIPPPSGWEPLESNEPRISFFNESKCVAFFLRGVKLHARNGCALKVFRGREKTKKLCWAGFDLEIEPGNGNTDSIELEYEAHFPEGKDDE